MDVRSRFSDQGSETTAVIRRSLLLLGIGTAFLVTVFFFEVWFMSGGAQFALTGLGIAYCLTSLVGISLAMRLPPNQFRRALLTSGLYPPLALFAYVLVGFIPTLGGQISLGLETIYGLATIILPFWPAVFGLALGMARTRRQFGTTLAAMLVGLLPISARIVGWLLESQGGEWVIAGVIAIVGAPVIALSVAPTYWLGTAFPGSRPAKVRASINYTAVAILAALFLVVLAMFVFAFTVGLAEFVIGVLAVLLVVIGLILGISVRATLNALEDRSHSS